MKNICFRRLTILILMVPFLSGCGSFGKKLKSFVSGSTEEEPQVKRSKVVKFSEQQSHATDSKQRNYQRMTRERFEQEARVNDNTGSLWVMEGQGAYIFSSNTLRLVGEVVNVKLEGNPRQQLETKTKVIKNLLAKLDKPKRKPASVKPGGAPDAKGATPEPPPPAEPAAEAGAEAKDKEKEEDSAFLVESVPARIIDRTVDGHYRVKGNQTFMIGKREYKVIVTGLAKPNDVNGDQIDSSKLLDPKFDIVSLKKELKL